MKKRLVVLVGGYYPYFGNPMGIVLEGLIEPLAGQFEVIVLALKRNPAQREIMPFVHRGAKVITVTSKLHEAVLINKRIAKMFCRFLSIIRVGRFEDYWIEMMFNELERLYDASPFDAILSLGFPMQMHEAAMRFREEHHRVKWVTYSTDSCYRNSNLVKIKPRSLARIAISTLIRRERIFRSKADFNFVSREIYNATAEAILPFLKKCAILDYTISPKEQANRLIKSDAIRIVYAGGLPVQMRDPSYFLKVLCAIPASYKIRLDVFVVGCKPVSLCEAARLFPERVVIHPSVSHSEIERIYAQDADVLLNLGNDSDVFSPSKLFDYISTGKPIIDVYYSGRLPNSAIMRHPLTFRLKNYGNAEADADALLRFLLNVAEKQLSERQIREIYPDYSPLAAAEKIADVLI